MPIRPLPRGAAYTPQAPDRAVVVDVASGAVHIRRHRRALARAQAEVDLDPVPALPFKAARRRWHELHFDPPATVQIMPPRRRVRLTTRLANAVRQFGQWVTA